MHTRREFLRATGLIAAALALSWRAAAGERTADKVTPNIIVILVDDMGFSDLGCYGSEIPTPNLDALAAGGVRFTQFYNAARCCPSRASLLTGLYPHQAGVGFMDSDGGLPGYRGCLNDRCVTIAEVLRGAGYFTATTGKWHVGGKETARPLARGFDRRYGMYNPGSYFKPGKDVLLNDKAAYSSNNPVPADWYSTDAWTDYGIKFIDEARAAKKPFFLYLAHNAPHFSLQAPAEDIARFRGKYMKGWDTLREERHAKQIELGIMDKAWPLSPRLKMRKDEVNPWDALTPDEKDRFDHKEKKMKRMSNVSTWAFVVGGLVALTFGSSRASAGELQSLLDKSKAFAALPTVKHTPAFRLEPFDAAQYPKEAQGKQWWYICDGKERVGLITTWFDGHVELFRFSPEVDKGAKYEIPAVYHWANLIGARLPTNGARFTFTKDAGDSLEFKTETTEFRLAWDERLGYVLNGIGHFATPKPQEIEFSNLLAGGISESRDDHKRWQKTMRGLLLDGRISFVHHNPVNIPKDDVQAGGFVGFVTEEKMNPFVEVLEANGPVYFATCSQWYDQHIRMKAPQTKEADGLYHVRARYRLLSVPGAVARELEAMAVVRDPATGESNKTGFLQNKVNDFETSVPYGKIYNGPIWQHINATEGVAHSGKRSIAVRGLGPGKVKSASPIGGGPAIYGESSKRYRLAAWVKTQGLQDGGAYLQVDDVFFNWEDVQATRRTGKLTGDHDWTRLEVDFTPSPRAPLLLIKLCVEGTGAAWFDDLELVEVAR